MKPTNKDTKKPAAKTTKKSKAAVSVELSKPPKREHAGRPPIFESPEEMQDKIDQYFTECDDKDKPYTIMGLALSIGMCRETLCEYAKNGTFSDIVKKAKLTVEKSVEERLFSGNSTGSIFWLKNHAGYKDKQEMEHSGVQTVRITSNVPD